VPAQVPSTGDLEEQEPHMSHPDGPGVRLTPAPRAPRHSPGSISPGEWEDSCSGQPHRDLGRPQPAFRALANACGIRGRVLDVGCGTGEHVHMRADLGLDATGADAAPAALHAPERKARDQGLTARFLLRDARQLADPGESFDTVLDRRLFHIVGDQDRAAFTRSVRPVPVPGGRNFMPCFTGQQPGGQGAAASEAEGSQHHSPKDGGSTRSNPQRSTAPPARTASGPG